MQNLKKTCLILGISLFSFFTMNCAQTTSSDNALTSSGNSAVSSVLESSVSTLGSALNESEKIATLSFQKKNQSLNFLYAKLLQTPNALAASCDLSRFTPAIGSVNCVGTSGNKTVQAVFNGCNVPASTDVLSGTVSLIFDSQATCDTWISSFSIPLSGNVTRTSSDFTRTALNGFQIKVNSSAHSNYAGAVISGGIKTIFSKTGLNTSVRVMDILGVHRTKSSATGTEKVYDHSVTTTESIVVSGLRATGDRQVSSGTIKVDNNLASYSASIAASQLVWSGSCCYPTSGSLKVTVTGKVNTSFTAVFTSSCGTLTVADSPIFQLASCE